MSGESNDPKVFLATELNNDTAELPQLGDGKLHPLTVNIDHIRYADDGLSEMGVQEETTSLVEIHNDNEVTNNNDFVAALPNKEIRKEGRSSDTLSGKDEQIDGISLHAPSSKMPLNTPTHRQVDDEGCVLKCLYITIQCCECTMM